jgi:serine protease Do
MSFRIAAMLRHAGLAGLLILAVTVSSGVAVPGRAAAQTSDAQMQKDMDALQRESKARAQILKRVSPSVVNVSVEKDVKGSDRGGDQPDPFDDEFFKRFFQPRIPQQPRDFKQRGLGSGTIVDSKGFILTNNHVVADADKIQVKLPDGRQFDAKLVGRDPATDVAVIKIDGTDLPAAKLGNSDDMEVGETVMAIGNPFSLEQTITSGIISAKGRSQVGVTDYEDFIQTDASINPGNSGGPLINLRGEVIGVNTAIFSRSGGNMGIGFSIPINEAREIMTQLIANGKVTRGFLGVVIQDITPEIAGALGVKANEGALVANVGPNTPAAKAGVKQGDVIVSFRGQPVKSVNALRYSVARVKPGETVAADVLTEGKRHSVSIKIEEQPADMRTAMGEGNPDQPDQNEPAAPVDQVLGMTLQALTPELADRMGYQGMKGILVADVDPNGPAAAAGIQQGALILEVNRRPARSVPDLKDQVQKTPSKKYLLMLVRLGNFDRYLALQKP